MKYIIVTAMNLRIFRETGEKMLRSILKYWENPDVRIYWQFTDEEEKVNINQILGDLRDKFNWNDQLWEDGLTPNPLAEFIKRNKNRPDQQNPLELDKGAIRFSYKSFAITDFLIDYDSFPARAIWLDADTEIFQPVTEEWLDSLMPEGKYCAYLGRTGNYSECGFVMYDLTHPQNKEFAENWLEYYLTDEIFMLPQWHDSYLFDVCREFYVDQEAWHNLTPWGKDYQHVWLSSELATRMDHMKGSRKYEGKSRFSDLADFKYIPPEMQERLAPEFINVKKNTDPSSTS